MPPDDREARLHEIHAELREIRDRLKAVREPAREAERKEIPRRNRLIREALELEDSQGELAIHTGLTQPTIHEISNR